mgnify:CR=1 FL=1
MESLDDKGDEFDTENLVVVAFYLITRESGLLFQNLANLIFHIENVNFSNIVNKIRMILLLWIIMILNF